MQGSVKKRGTTWSYRIDFGKMEITDFVNVKINGEMLSTNSVKFMSGIFKEELHIDFKFHNPSGQSLILRVTLFQFARAATTNKDKIVFINQSNQIGQ